MELREFIANTITEIQHGVQQAIDQTSDVKGAVNPVWGPGNMNREHIQKVSFDIAVTVAEKSDKHANAGIKVMGIGVGANASKASENNSVSRIQFTIPIIPTGQVIVGSTEEKT